MKAVKLHKEGIIPTPKEIALVKAYSEDNTRKEVANILGIRVRTLDGRLEDIKTKYGVKSIAALCVLFYKNKIID